MAFKILAAVLLGVVAAASASRSSSNSKSNALNSYEYTTEGHDKQVRGWREILLNRICQASNLVSFIRDPCLLHIAIQVVPTMQCMCRNILAVQCRRIEQRCGHLTFFVIINQQSEFSHR